MLNTVLAGAWDKDVDVLYFVSSFLAGGVTPHASTDPGKAIPVRKKNWARLEKAVLRIALYELSKRSDVPYKVAINEAIELAKSFGAEDII